MVFLLQLLIWTMVPAHAEYRAYELSIENLDTGTTRTVTSTLDHIQYARYYHVYSNEVVYYVDSWMCWDNTGQRPICAKPEPGPAPTVPTPVR